MQCLREIGVDGKDIKIIRNLYWDQTASVRIMNELSDEIRIQRGVRQGCVASPTLFNLFTETTTNRREDRRQKIPWPTKKYLYN